MSYIDAKPPYSGDRQSQWVLLSSIDRQDAPPIVSHGKRRYIPSDKSMEYILSYKCELVKDFLVNLLRLLSLSYLVTHN